MFPKPKPESNERPIKMVKTKRKRYGVWQLWLTKGLQKFRPILPRVAAKLKMKEADLIRDAVLRFLAEHDDEAAKLLQDWKSLHQP